MTISVHTQVLLLLPTRDVAEMLLFGAAAAAASASAAAAAATQYAVIIESAPT
jgi:hypothetical protein